MVSFKTAWGLKTKPTTKKENNWSDDCCLLTVLRYMWVIAKQFTHLMNTWLLINSLTAFHGGCSCRPYIPPKPSKYGIKMYALIDVKTYYMFNLEIYPGTQTPGFYLYSNKSNDIVDRLTALISQTNWKVTFNNWFTSLWLMLNLITEHKFTKCRNCR